MDRRVAAHGKQREEDRKVAEHHHEVHGQDLVQLTTQQLEKIHQIRVFPDLLLVLGDAVAVGVGFRERIEDFCFRLPFFCELLLLRRFQLV